MRFAAGACRFNTCAMLDRVDDMLIDRTFQPVVEWVARHSGLDCFQQARACTNVAAIAWIWSQAADVVAAVRSGLAGPQTFQAALLLLGLGAIMVLNTLFQRGGVAGGHGRANPLRAGMYAHRMCLLLGLLVNICNVTAGLGSCALLAVGVFAAVSVYVGACSNPPPQQRGVYLGGRGAAVGARRLDLRARSTTIATICGVERALSLCLRGQLYRRADAPIADAALRPAAERPSFAPC